MTREELKRRLNFLKEMSKEEPFVYETMRDMYARRNGYAHGFQQGIKAAKDLFEEYLKELENGYT